MTLQTTNHVNTLKVWEQLKRSLTATAKASYNQMSHLIMTDTEISIA